MAARQVHRGIEVRRIGGQNGIENGRRFSEAAGSRVHPATIDVKGCVVRAKCDQLIQQRDGLVEFAFESQLRGFLEQRGEPAAVLADFVRPWIGPCRLSRRSDGEGESRSVLAAEPPVGRAQQLQRVAIARTGGQQFLQPDGGLGVLTLR